MHGQAAQALKLNQVLDFARLIHEVDMNLISDRYIKMFLSHGGEKRRSTSLTTPTKDDATRCRASSASRIIRMISKR